MRRPSFAFIISDQSGSIKGLAHPGCLDWLSQSERSNRVSFGEGLEQKGILFTFRFGIEGKLHDIFLGALL